MGRPAGVLPWIGRHLLTLYAIAAVISELHDLDRKTDFRLRVARFASKPYPIDECFRLDLLLRDSRPEWCGYGLDYELNCPLAPSLSG